MTTLTSAQVSSVTTTALLIPSVCLVIETWVEQVVQSIGLDYELLCPADGEFSSRLASLSACAALYTVEKSANSTSALFETAIEWCSQNEPKRSIAITSACCGTDEELKSLIPSCSVVITSSQKQCPHLTSTLSSQSTSTSNAATPGQTTQTISSPTPNVSSSQTSAAGSNSDSNPNTPNVGLIAGAAVGATAGFFLLIAVVGLFLWRRKKQRATRKSQEAALPPAESEKAQLHSQDLKPRREELPGAPVTFVRSVGGLEEMDGTHSVNYVRELPANEDVASEILTEVIKGGTSSTART